MSSPADQTVRQGWLAVLASAEPDEVHQAWEALDGSAELTTIRAPEIGLVMAPRA